jgi:capsule polysaccharide export protein KpsE/RkpR
MTKQALQQELLEKVKPGTKPSQLKRSKSAGDISVKEAKSLNRSKSAQELEPVNHKETVEQWENKVSILELKLETQARELTELNSLQAENEHLKAQSKVKQQEIEQLRKGLEEKNTELSQIKAELDKSLEARHQGLKE